MILKNKIKKIIDAIKDTDINQIEISSFWGAQKIKMSKSIPLNEEKNINLKKDNNTIEVDLAADDTSKEITLDEDFKDNKNIDNQPIISLTEIRAPLVGTFYISSKPGDPPFISVGDLIKEGQIICIIEAMKIFNEIESEVSGRVENIFIKDSTPVEYDQVLISINPE